MGAVGVVGNSVFAYFFLKEPLSCRDITGTLIVVIGVVLLVIGAPEGGHNGGGLMTHKEIEVYFSQPAAYIYFSICVVLGIVNLVLSRKYGNKTVHCFTLLAANIGAYTVVFAKAVSTMAAQLPVNVGTATFWIGVVMLILCAVVSTKYLNDGMHYFDNTIVIPTYYCYFTLASIVATSIIYREYEQMITYPWKIPMFLGGLALLLSGVWLVTVGGKRSSDNHKKLEEEEEEEEDKGRDEEQQQTKGEDSAAGRSGAGSGDDGAKSSPSAAAAAAASADGKEEGGADDRRATVGGNKQGGADAVTTGKSARQRAQTVAGRAFGRVPVLGKALKDEAPADHMRERKNTFVPGGNFLTFARLSFAGAMPSDALDAAAAGTSNKYRGGGGDDRSVAPADNDGYDGHDDGGGGGAAPPATLSLKIGGGGGGGGGLAGQDSLQMAKLHRDKSKSFA